MFRIIIYVTALCSVLFSFSQRQKDTTINVTGNIFSSKDSSLVTAIVHFDKLPYYDDMGKTSGNQGTYSLKLVKGQSYLFWVKQEGFKDFSKEISIVGDDQLNQKEDLYLEVDEIQLIKLENLIFARGSDKITSSSYQELNELAEWLNTNSTIVIQLEGHTDFRGNSEANLRLSEARVVSTRDYLIKKGVKKNRILTKAFGGSQPLSREDSDEAKALNRRVEVRVIRR